MPRSPHGSPDQRRQVRLKAFQPAVVRIGDRHDRLHFLDVSARGALCHLPEPPDVGREVVLDYRLWRVSARVVWVAGTRFGIRFEHELAPAMLTAILSVGGPRPAARSPLGTERQ